MKFKYLLTIKYDGSKFYGWNKQPNLVTIHSSIENALVNVFNEKVKIISSGRTDRYVHAKRQIFSIEENYDKNKIKKIKFCLNKIEGIKIIKIEKVLKKFHPRFDSISKTYLYKIQVNKNTAKEKNKNYEFQYFYKYNLKLLINDSKKFIGKKNFASFSSKQNYNSYEREIFDIKIYKRFSYIYIEVTGNGFMRYMVRNIVGSLLAKNRNKYTEEQFNDLFLNPKRGKSHFKAPGSGLYLKKVNYKK